MLTLLEKISKPDDLKALSFAELTALASEIRKRIVQVVSANGGHLASNLGVVDLTIALHRVFQSPHDAIVWDVSHQSYAHKILTGRNAAFDTLRQKDGISGFTKRSESEHDWFDAGHASTGISSALGLLAGRRLLGIDGKVIAVVGDGALTGGMAIEAMSHAGQLAKDLIIILNDNQMSISGNTGSLSRYLSRLTTTAQYQSFRYNFDRLIEGIPFLGKPFTKVIFRLKRAMKGLFFPNNLFSDLGFEYVGPLNAHRIEEMVRVLSRVKKIKNPVVVHLLSQKGRGYAPAEKDPILFHGVGPFMPDELEGADSVSRQLHKKAAVSTLSFTEVFERKIVDLAEIDKTIAAVTAAMTSGTGLSSFAQKFPCRFYDVGIAEQHAVTFAGGLARSGLKPLVAIYSTFIQRAVDQLIHDISLQQASVVFVLDRSGPVPADGETHQGIFDIALLRPVPNVALLTPASQGELESFLEWAFNQNGPVIIRYPKALCPPEKPEFLQQLEKGRGVLISCGARKSQTAGGEETAQMLFVCTGGILPEVLDAAEILKKQGKSADVYNLRFLKPLDKEYFLSIAAPYKRVLFVEDGIRIGGIGTYLESLLDRNMRGKKTGVSGFPDRFIPQGSRKEILENARLNGDCLAQKALKLWE